MSAITTTSELMIRAAEVVLFCQASATNTYCCHGFGFFEGKVLLVFSFSFCKIGTGDDSSSPVIAEEG